MELYQNLNAALREREMEAMRLQLESLKQDLETKLEAQAATDVLKTNEIQDLRSQLQKLQNERDRMAMKVASQTKSTLQPQNVPKANTVAPTKSGGRAVTTASPKKLTAKPGAKPPSVAVKKPSPPVAKKSSSPAVKTGSKSKRAVQMNSGTGGVKWS